MASWFAWRVAPASSSSKPVDDDWEEDDVGEGMCIKTAAVSTISSLKKTSSPSTTKTISTSTSTSTVTPTFTTSSTTHIGATEGEAKSAPLLLPSAPPSEPTHRLTLAEENARLRTALASLTQQLKSGDTSKIHMTRLDGNVHPEQLMSQDDLQEFIAGLTKSLDEPTEEKAELITSDTDSSRSLFVRQQGDNIDEQEVALVDLDGIEWWTLVNPEEEEMERTHVDEKEMSDEGYVVLGNDDMRSALAEFIRQTMDRYPESQRLTPDQLKQMLEGTFQNLKEPSAMHKVWNWGKMLYTTYGWGSTALALYNDQRVIRLVATGLFKAATWVLVLVV